MSNTRRDAKSSMVFWAAGTILAAMMGCAATEETSTSRRSIPAGQDYTGFLTDYSSLTPSNSLDSDSFSYVNTDVEKHLRRYVGIIVDPVEIYLATEADTAEVSEEGVEAVKAYFRTSLIRAVSDAFPVVDQPGPLVLRLRSALAGIDVGSTNTRSGDDSGGLLGKSITIEEVFVEVELVDSDTGEVIAAALDRANLGAGAEVGAADFARMERFEAAREALRGWAERIRAFLDSEHELTEEEIVLADEAYQPYGE